MRLHAADDLGGLDIQHSRQLDQHTYRWTPDTALNQAHVGSVKASLQS